MQKFHLGEVLALTAYTPPQSAFNTGMWDGDTSAQHGGKFPIVGDFSGSFNGFGNRGMHVVHVRIFY